MTFPKAESRSSTRWIFTLGGNTVSSKQLAHYRLTPVWQGIPYFRLSPVWQGIPYLLKLLICGATGHQKPMSVPHSHPSNDSGIKGVSKFIRPNWYRANTTSILIIEATPAACYRGIAHWNHICQLCLKGAEKIKDNNRTESVRDRHTYRNWHCLQ